MPRKRTFKTWKHADAGRCLNCGTLYVPEPHKGGEYKEGNVEEMGYCELCALRCPHCDEWLSSVEGEEAGRYEYTLTVGETTGRFGLDENECWGHKLLSAWCPRCGEKLNKDLFDLS